MAKVLSVFAHFGRIKIVESTCVQSRKKYFLLKKLKNEVFFNRDVWKWFGINAFEAMLLFLVRLLNSYYLSIPS
jgi:hypothetical protein